MAGLGPHAGTRCDADQRKQLERLCSITTTAATSRYITRPAIANERLKLNAAGQVVLQLKSAYQDGATHVVMSPLEFMQRLTPGSPGLAHPRPAALTSTPTRVAGLGPSVPSGLNQQPTPVCNPAKDRARPAARQTPKTAGNQPVLAHQRLEISAQSGNFQSTTPLVERQLTFRRRTDTLMVGQ